MLRSAKGECLFSMTKTQRECSPSPGFEDQLQVGYKVDGGWMLLMLTRQATPYPLLCVHKQNNNRSMEAFMIAQPIKTAYTGVSCLHCSTIPPAAAASNSSNTNRLLRCARCHRACYCNAICQRADWAQHKKTCQLLSLFRRLYPHTPKYGARGRQTETCADAKGHSLQPCPRNQLGQQRGVQEFCRVFQEVLRLREKRVRFRGSSRL